MTVFFSSFGQLLFFDPMLLIELVTWGVTNQDVLLLPTIRKAKMTVKTHAIEFFRFQFNLSVREDFEPP